ncbi:MAG: hypothetical protein KDB90_03300 [Planctomycetes bacterium]|nr:hypothetical protein [Planctomycetota bacterium]
MAAAEYWEYIGRDGPDDYTYVAKLYWPDGRLKACWDMNVNTAAFTTYDRRGRIRYDETYHLPRVVDLSNVAPGEIAWETRWQSLEGVYIVDNDRINDKQVLALYNDSRIRWMIVERCSRVSRDCLRTIRPKLVHRPGDQHRRSSDQP